MTRNALLGLAVLAFGIAGLAIGVVRLAPRADAVDAAIAIAAAAVGAGVFAVVLRLGRRGRGAQARWVLVPAIAAAVFLDRLPERWQLALLALAAGYVGAFVATVTVRAVRIHR